MKLLFSRLLCGVIFAVFLMSSVIAAEKEGTVIQTIDAGNYIYVQVSQGGENLWLAATVFKAKEGDLVRFDEGMEMQDFYSKTLDRTFPSVFFVSRIEVIAALSKEGKVLQTIDSGGYTYAEIAQKGESKNIWIAGPQVKVAQGDLVQFDQGSEMRNFFSKTLNRSFPIVLFVTRIDVIKEK